MILIRIVPVSHWQFIIIWDQTVVATEESETMVTGQNHRH